MDMRYDYLINQVLLKLEEVETAILFQNIAHLDKK